MCDTSLNRFEGTIITKTREFSNVSIHHPRQNSQEFTEYHTDEDKLRYQYKPEIYANGNNGSHQGYVCLVFNVLNLPDTMINLTITFLISLVDVEGREKFTRSFTFVIDKPSNAGHIITIKEYISRHILLKEATELIPDDTLTLSIKICLEELKKKEFQFGPFQVLLQPSFETEDGPNGRRIFLLLDSLVANHLEKESEFFRRKSDTLWKGTGKIEISYEEYETFIVFECLVFGANSLKFKSIDDIISLYVVSHRYGMNTMINTMRHFLKDCISTETVDDISEFADFYDDKYLKNAVMFFKGLNEESDKDFMEYCETHFPPIKKRWILKRLNKDQDCTLMFDSVVEMPAFHKKEFDFYD